MVSVVMAAPAAAEDASAPQCDPCWWAPVGLTLGVGVPSGAAFIGGEASFVYFKGRDGVRGKGAVAAPWAGGYLDALYDVQRERTRLSLGPELGYGPYGLD